MGKTFFKGDKRDREIAWQIYMNMADYSVYFDKELYDVMYGAQITDDASEEQLLQFEKGKWRNFGLSIRNMMLNVLAKSGYPKENRVKGQRKPMRIDATILDIMYNEIHPYIKRVAKWDENVAEGVTRSIEDQAQHIHRLLTRICEKAAYDGEFMIDDTPPPQPAPSETDPGKSTGSSAGESEAGESES